MRRLRYQIECSVEDEMASKAALSCADEKEGKRAEQKQSSRKTKQNITWAKMANYIEIPHVNDLDSEILEAQWMTADELKAIKVVVKETARKIMEGGTEDDEKICFRGLESRTKAGCRARYSNKTRAWDAVMDEQYIQGPRSDQISIAMASMRVTINPRLEACGRGSDDEKSIREYLADVRAIIETTNFGDSQ